MSKIVIKKRVSLEFLGEDYKDAYLLFKAMPISAFESFQREAEKVEESKSVQFLLSKLKENFLGGMFPVDDKLTSIDAEDLDSFDAQSIVKAFEAYTGVNPDPKD